MTKYAIFNSIYTKGFYKGFILEVLNYMVLENFISMFKAKIYSKDGSCAYEEAYNKSGSDPKKLKDFGRGYPFRVLRVGDYFILDKIGCNVSSIRCMAHQNKKRFSMSRHFKVSEKGDKVLVERIK